MTTPPPAERCPHGVLDVLDCYACTPKSAEPAAEVREDLGPHKTLPPEDFDRLASDLYSERPKEWWILRTPAGEFLDNDEPMKMDWTLCSKIHVIEKSAYDAQVKRAAETYAHYESELARKNWEALDAITLKNAEIEKLKAERDELRREQDHEINKVINRAADQMGALRRELSEAKARPNECASCFAMPPHERVQLIKERDEALSKLAGAERSRDYHYEQLQIEKRELVEARAEVTKLQGEVLSALEAHSATLTKYAECVSRLEDAQEALEGKT